MLIGDRVRWKATGVLGWVESLSPVDVVVRLDERTSQGNVLAFRFDELEVVASPPRSETP
jgi:hypothetical protein